MTRRLKPGEPGFLRARAEGLTGVKHNGVALGAGSPLLTAGGARRKLARDERDEQKAVVEALLGKLGPGQDRQLGLGMTARYPELLLLNANNPNKGGRKKAAAGIAKAMGLCPHVPDLHLPVTRGPFLTLYVEMKRRGVKPREGQRELHTKLRCEGHCVLACDTAQQAIDGIVGYLALPVCDLSLHPAAPDRVAAELRDRRRHYHALLGTKLTNV